MSFSAEPILASTIFRALRRESNSRKRKRLGTACSVLDDALRGGFDYSRIGCISGEKGTGKTAISLHLLATHILNSADAQAAVIDTTGTFDVLKLHQAIFQRLQSQNAVDMLDHDVVEGRAEAVLDRVRIMRVFDFVGVSEAVNELRAELQPPPAIVLDQEQEQEAHQIRGTIPDSEDEDDEMLFDVEQAESPPKLRDKVVEWPPDESAPKLGFLLINNIAHVVNPLLKSNYAQGQALLTTFMRSLSHLTTSFDILTLIINTAVNPRPAYSFSTTTIAPQSTWIDDPTARPPSFLDQPSIFAASTARPALGKPFLYYIDLHLLLNTLPKKRRDAEIVYGGKVGKAEFVTVVEVLGDRLDGRLGRWTAIVIEGGVKLREAF